MKEGRVLKMKLMPPPLKKQLLHRPRIAKRLSRIPDFPLTVLTSGPGFGKTTALSAFLRSSDLTYAWYGVSPQDNDFIPFVSHIVYTLRQAVPGFGETMLGDLKGGSRRGSEDIYALADLFLNELTALPQQTLLIIDDYHLVEATDSIEQWMQYVLVYLPDCDKLRIVISSRSRPQWDSLASMRIHGHLLELAREDLAFNEEEIDVLFSDYYDHPLTSSEVRRVHEQTEGWVIAVQLIWQRLLASNGTIAEALDAPRETMEDLFQYLALELFQKQPPSMRTFMLETSIFDELTGEWCDAVCARHGSHALLLQLCGTGMLSAVDERQFRYHTLFREFLTEQLGRQPERRESLLRQAVHVFAARKRYDLAITQAAALQDTEEMALLLQDGGGELIRNGRLELVCAALTGLPERIKHRHPYLLVLQGDIFRYQCQYEASGEQYRMAEYGAGSVGNRMVQMLALEGQSLLYLDTIRPGLAEPLLERAIALAEALFGYYPPLAEEAEAGLSAEQGLSGPTGNRADPQAQAGLAAYRSAWHGHAGGRQTLARLYAMMAENMLNAGRGMEAQIWYDRAIHVDRGSRDWILEARLCLRTGRLREARAKLLRAEQLERGEGMPYNGLSYHPKTLSRSHREIDLLLSMIDSMRGEPAPAKRAAEDGMMHGIRLKAPFVEACGWMRMGHAAQLMGTYDAGVAADCYHEALAIMERLEVKRGSAEPYMGLCLLYGRARSAETALRYGQTAWDGTQSANDGWLTALIRLSMGIALFYDDRCAEAEQVLRECGERFVACGDQFGCATAEMWQALIAYRLERDSWFAVSMERFLTLAEQEGYAFLFTRRTLFGPSDTQQLIPLLIEAVRLDLCRAYAASLLSELGMDRLTYHPGYTLYIDTLGEFRVRLGDVGLEEKDWQRGKAKELFQLLVTRRHRPVSKEELLCQLFPEAEEKAANRDFKVALNALNTALEPHRRARSVPYFILRRGQAYQLNPGAGWVLDADRFEQSMARGLEADDTAEAVSRLEEGLRLYQGDYMPDRRYEDWCIEERERLQVLFMRGAERLSRHYIAAEAYDKAVHWAEEMAAKDRCWEEAYRILIACHLRMNNRNQALKWYRKCAAALQDELGIEPMPSIRDLMASVTE
ncbi:hypothetical protein M5W83_00520 [Paenibacillus thiaminolyticus]|uniref:Bacterial transcriptional activator domain-containing protein n=1 Tax=Paenibacillus thiaminolyticus TaxID=49283 RepID=A0AAP9DYK6_PANTH|nr:BTAD domain-containing putative transcriptional regulator [Paenibacillus thiaminolyticus]MCY9536207.1 hypothetical protein [Paenibacillus thiaminolyticus]MCY9603528.1 hypothetical protein [Paenibacillus thiaminolyticus]MCY9605662.1 hypothetical protein [Paenibacillus thiaminolyticus]MCY9611837.1 hypothetical protein [Paenibacillus thiaminolyticus]MCY9620964.1 hypothetical protein [Paenibacillus thiaminolyticus]